MLAIVEQKSPASQGDPMTFIRLDPSLPKGPRGVAKHGAPVETL